MLQQAPNHIPPSRASPSRASPPLHVGPTNLTTGTTKPDGTPVDENTFPYLEVMVDCGSEDCLNLHVEVTRQAPFSFPQIVHCPKRGNITVAPHQVRGSAGVCNVVAAGNANVNQLCAGPAVSQKETGGDYHCEGKAQDSSQIVVNCYDEDVKQGKICNAEALGNASKAIVRPFH